MDFGIDTGALGAKVQGIITNAQKQKEKNDKDNKSGNNIFNNALAGIGGTFLSSLLDQVGSDAIAMQEEESWYNKTGWFGSLQNAQAYNMEYMAKNKERIPMIIEYLSHSLGLQAGTANWKNGANRISVTMYINPSRLELTNQKIIGKQVTRGGIFYHHWGDDHTLMNISGSLGMSSMSGVKKLDQIYRMSGTLLAYGENNSGPISYSADEDFLTALANGDWASVATAVITGKVGIQDLLNMAKKQASGAAIDAITGRSTNGGPQSSAVGGAVTAILGSVLGKAGELTGNANNVLTGDSQWAKLGNGILGNLIGGLGEKLGGKVLKNKRRGALDYLEENAVTWEQAFQGFSDVVDELEDPWRPRLVWIYFENRVYIGHFQSFNYTRDAASVNINYQMSFVIQREIEITSFSPTLPAFTPAPGGIEA